MVIEFEFIEPNGEAVVFDWNVPWEIEAEMTGVCVAEAYGIEPENFLKMWNDLSLVVTETFECWAEEHEEQIKKRIKELYPDIAYENYQKKCLEELFDLAYGEKK